MYQISIADCINLQPLLTWQRSHLEQKKRETVITIGFSAPCWQEAHLMRLIQEHLQQVLLTAPVTRLRLRADQTQAWQVDNDDLFSRPGGRPGDHAMLIGLLRARLGQDAILEAAPQKDHRPEYANHWQALSGKWSGSTRKPERAAKSGPKSGSKSGQQPQTMSSSLPAPDSTLANRPFWLLPAPRKLRVEQDHPLLRPGKRLQLLGSGERIETGWWDDGLVQRDYFIAADQDAHRYWIFRTRAGRDWEWFLHGLFA